MRAEEVPPILAFASVGMFSSVSKPSTSTSDGSPLSTSRRWMMGGISAVRAANAGAKASSSGMGTAAAADVCDWRFAGRRARGDLPYCGCARELSVYSSNTATLTVTIQPTNTR